MIKSRSYLTNIEVVSIRRLRYKVAKAAGISGQDVRVSSKTMPGSIPYITEQAIANGNHYCSIYGLEGYVSYSPF